MANAVGEYTFVMPLTEAEKAMMERQYFENSLHIARAQEDLDRAKEVFKDTTKIQRDQNKDLMHDLRVGSTERTVRATAYPVYEEGIIEFYEEGDDTGVPVFKRAMTRQEKKQYQLEFKQQQKVSQN